MIDKQDIELLEEYEELIALLRQLHSDVPVLEKQHLSIREAFISAQAKLEKTIMESDAKLQQNKMQILTEFEKECTVITERVLVNMQTRLTELFKKALDDAKKECQRIASTTVTNAETAVRESLKEIEKKEKDVTKLLKKADSITQIPPSPEDNSKKRKPRMPSIPELEDGFECTGKQILEQFATHINRDLFVKRIGKKNGRAWNNDFCMFVTEVSEGMICGDRYKDGDLYDEQVSYGDDDLFIIYRGPSEKTILKSRGK